MTTNRPDHDESAIRSSLFDNEKKTRDAERRRQKATFTPHLVCRYLSTFALIALALTTYYAYRPTLIIFKELFGIVSFIHHDLRVNPYAPQPNQSAIVSPLVNSSSTFDVRATVWLDVTQHLNQGYLLPQVNGAPMPLVAYDVFYTSQRIDAILYDDVLFRNVRWNDAQYANLPLNIPIDPLYTQDIGPSSLRISYQIVYNDKQKQKDIGKLHRFTTIFPETMSRLRPNMFLPRSLASKRIKRATRLPNGEIRKTQIDRDESVGGDLMLAQAFEKLGASDSLLTLRQTGRRKVGCKESNLWGRSQKHNYFSDNAPSMRSFNNGNYPFDESDHRRRTYIGENCTIWTPHLQLRSSVFMVTHQQEFRRDAFQQRHTSLTHDLRDCIERPDEATCKVTVGSLRENGPLESLLEFHKDVSDDVQENADADHATSSESDDYVYADTGHIYRPTYRYAPQLVHRPGSTPPHHLHTLPLSRPTKPNVEEQSKRISPSSDRCALPVLEAEETLRFFPVSMQVRFGFIPSWRLQNQRFFPYMDDVISKGLHDTLEDDDGNGKKDARILTTPAENDAWEADRLLFGDQEHPNSKPGTILLSSLIRKALGYAILFLRITYWNTRVGTEGLSRVALAFDILGESFGFASEVKGYIEGQVGLIGVLFTDGHAILAILQFLLLAKLDIYAPANGQPWHAFRISQRRSSRRERLSERAEEKLGIIKSVIFACAMIGVQYAFTFHDYVLYAGHGCFSSMGREVTTQDLPLSTAFTMAAMLLQLLFNTISPSFGRQHGQKKGKQAQGTQPLRRGSFAGMFKLTAWLNLVSHLLLVFTRYGRAIGGYVHRQPDLTLGTCFWLLDVVIAAVQATLYPGVALDVSDCQASDNDDVQGE